MPFLLLGNLLSVERDTSEMCKHICSWGLATHPTERGEEKKAARGQKREWWGQDGIPGGIWRFRKTSPKGYLRMRRSTKGV
jgi:hypothetical protein